VSELNEELPYGLRITLPGVDGRQAPQELGADPVRRLDLLVDRGPGVLDFRENDHGDEHGGQARHD